MVDDVTSVRREVAPWAEMTEVERWRLARLCSRDAIWAAKASGNPERVLGYVDPLPESSIRALARLRAEAGWGDDDAA